MPASGLATRMKHTLVILFPLLLVASLKGQDQYDAFAAEIAALKTPEAIKSYWKSIRQDDQRYRGIDALDSNDCNNLVKVVAMVEKHGYPAPAVFGDDIAFTPVIVMVHQNSLDACYGAFPLLFQAYQDGLVGYGNMLYFLEGFHHSVFGQYYEPKRGPHKNSGTDVSRLCARLHLDTTLQQKAQVVSILRQEKLDRMQDHPVTVIGRWQGDNGDKYICYSKKQQYFLKLLYLDHSFCLPKVTLKKAGETTRIDYAPSFYGDYFIVNKAGDLEFYEAGVFKKTYPKV